MQFSVAEPRAPHSTNWDGLGLFSTSIKEGDIDNLKEKKKIEGMTANKTTQKQSKTKYKEIQSILEQQVSAIMK